MALFKKYRVHSIFFTSIFMFTVLILVTIIFFSYHFSSSHLIETTTDYQKSNLHRLSDDIADNLQSFQDYSVILSRQQNFRELISGRGQGQASLRSRAALTNDFSNVIYSVQALHSIEIYMNSPPVDNIQLPVRYLPLDDIYDSDWFHHLEDIAYGWLGNREVETVAGKTPVISFGRKINTSNGDLSSVMIINLDPVMVEGWLRKENDNDHFVMLDQEGAIVATTGDNAIGDTRFEEFAAEMEGSPAASFELNDDLIVMSSVSGMNWTLMQVTPYEEVTAGSAEMARNLILIGVAFVILILGGTVFLTKKFTYPILQLADVMKSYRLNQERVQLPEGYKNEFGELFEGFEELTANMEGLYSSLDEQHRRQREAEIKALQANINPHFLYNTLDQLNWMAVEKGNIDISRMIELLGKMLRIGLSKGESIITIKDELTYLEYYMKLQEIQLEDRLSYSIEAPAELLKYEIPKLTFQPFVENAIIHGFQGKSYGSVRINVEESSRWLVCTISDNGIGFQLNPDNLSVSQLGGYGIKNVKERLHVYYGKQTDVRIESTEKGTVVTITIPKVINNKRPAI